MIFSSQFWRQQARHEAKTDAIIEDYQTGNRAVAEAIREIGECLREMSAQLHILNERSKHA